MLIFIVRCKTNQKTFFHSLANRVDYRPDKGIYDLRITNASYNRDNGRFECRIKASGTGDDVHKQYYNLTVLTPPQPPLVAPGSIVVATEEKKQELTCSSIGGSPDPTITLVFALLFSITQN